MGTDDRRLLLIGSAGGSEQEEAEGAEDADGLCWMTELFTAESFSSTAGEPRMGADGYG